MAGKVSKKGLIRNSLEAVTNIGDASGVVRGAASSLVNDLALDGGKDFLSFLGMDVASKDKKDSDKSSQESPNTETGSIDIVNFQEKAKKVEQHVEAAIDYHRDILRSSERISKQEIQSLSNQVEQIKMEIQSLIASTKEIQMEFSQVTMEQHAENVGTYHTNFFEWMIIMIRDARKKVEESSNWLNAQKGKGQKKGYWGMFKKHGTSFALSNERGVATQVG